MTSMYHILWTKVIDQQEVEEHQYNLTTGDQLYEALYDLEPYPCEILDFNSISMFLLERTLQQYAHIYLKYKEGTILISWFPDPDDTKSIPHLSITDTDYPNLDLYDGYQNYQTD